MVVDVGDVEKAEEFNTGRIPVTAHLFFSDRSAAATEIIDLLAFSPQCLPRS